jgi:catechol 2,3-dioxygenase-like lactoylglutathione lyase family enzyme
MFSGTHILFYSADPPADRAFMREVLGFPFVDTGHDWLIFKLPTAEAGVHPQEGPNMPRAALVGADEAEGGGFMVATVWMMVVDVAAAVAKLAAKGVDCPEPQNEGWGISTSFALPSGARLGLYQPLHPTALAL